MLNAVSSQTHSGVCNSFCSVVYFGDQAGGDVIIAGVRRAGGPSFNTKGKVSSTLVSSGMYFAGTNRQKEAREV